jgi:hypothetical protein
MALEGNKFGYRPGLSWRRPAAICGYAMILVLPRASLYFTTVTINFQGHCQLAAAVKMSEPESYLVYAAWLRAIVNIYILKDIISLL